MKKYLFGLLLALTACVSLSATDRVLREGQNSATLLVEPCVLPFLSEDVQKQAHAARMHIEGKTYQACFIEKNGSVMIIDEEEDVYGPFPAGVFVPSKEA